MEESYQTLPTRCVCSGGGLVPSYVADSPVMNLTGGTCWLLGCGRGGAGLGTASSVLGLARAGWVQRS